MDSASSFTQPRSAEPRVCCKVSLRKHRSGRCTAWQRSRRRFARSRPSSPKGLLRPTCSTPSFVEVAQLFGRHDRRHRSPLAGQHDGRRAHRWSTVHCWGAMTASWTGFAALRRRGAPRRVRRTGRHSNRERRQPRSAHGIPRACSAQVTTRAGGFVRDVHNGAQQRLVHTIVTLKRAQRALHEEGQRVESLLAAALDHVEQGNSNGRRRHKIRTVRVEVRDDGKSQGRNQPREGSPGCKAWPIVWPIAPSGSRCATMASGEPSPKVAGCKALPIVWPHSAAACTSTLRAPE